MNLEEMTLQDGFGQSTMEELNELRKALEIGTTGAATVTGANSLRVESLEATLKVASYQAQHAKLWNMIDKIPAFSTVEEYNKLSAYGSEAGGFVASGVLPEEEDSTYSRQNQFVKYVGSTRVVHHPATLVNTVPSDLISRETLNGALWLIGKINTGLYYGNATNIPVEWNGLINQIEANTATIIDMRGAALTQAAVDNAAQQIVDNFGMPQTLFSNGRVFSDFSKAFHDNQRWASPGGNRPGSAGTPVSSYWTTNGEVKFEPDTFVKRGSTPPASATSTKAPSAPTFADGTPSGTNDSSNWTAADAGVYKYQITAVNQYGESAPSALSTGITIAVAGETVATCTITDGGGTYPATAYKIYRTEKGGATAYYTGWMVARDAATTVFADVNDFLPRCFYGLLLDMTPQSLSFKQLSPMVKMPLAQIAPSIRWMQLLYGTPIVYNPLRNVVFRNIGVTA